MDGASREADRAKNLTNPDESTMVASLSDRRPDHPLLKRGDDWEEKVFDNLDTVSMMIAGLNSRRTGSSTAEAPEQAEAIEEESMRLSFRVLHEVKHFSKMVFKARGNDIDGNHHRVSRDRWDFSTGRPNDPRIDRVLRGLNAENAVLEECRKRINRAINDALADIKTLMDAEYMGRAKD